ncbi:unnamed protein product [Kuraishia capsulata CBS 1993]|uniref:Brl1/Brr6 domain-containing protein n=1 Tax=Kuraishia capsulata CBS 1993 TaxID=1382522 RepID=W6MHI7_9ASCO|nr:uncharacterized protein KUCA_T00001426001 [Kuraishia capsulata CBS 1993]CDK25456.1 unnamed protein product [Kuraishia capsulata CBS 1993]
MDFSRLSLRDIEEYDEHLLSGLSLREDDGSLRAVDMDIDDPNELEDTDTDVEMVPVTYVTHTTPSRQRFRKDDENLARRVVCKSEEVEEQEDSEDIGDANSSSIMETVSNVLAHMPRSPTAYGARLALELRRRPNKPSFSTPILSGIEHSTPPRDNAYTYETYETQQVSPVRSSQMVGTPGTPWNNAPVSFQMHHHHYYTPQQPENAYHTPAPYLPQPWQHNIIPQERTPYLLSSYLQLVVNAVVTFYSFGIIYRCIATVKSDISEKMEEHVHKLMVEGAICRRSFLENGCDPEHIVPAMEEQCAEWEKCMGRDPYASGAHSSVSAETLGMIINSLVEPIGFKSFLFLAGIMGVLFLFNVSFGFFRAKSYYGWDAGSGSHEITQVQSPVLQTPGYWNTQRYDRGAPLVSPTKDRHQ